MIFDPFFDPIFDPTFSYKKKLNSCRITTLYLHSVVSYTILLSIFDKKYV